MTVEASGPTIAPGPNTFEIKDARVFGAGGGVLARRFAGRVLVFDEVRSLALDPARATATVDYRLINGDPGMLLARLGHGRFPSVFKKTTLKSLICPTSQGKFRLFGNL